MKYNKGRTDKYRSLSFWNSLRKIWLSSDPWLEAHKDLYPNAYEMYIKNVIKGL